MRKMASPKQKKLRRMHANQTHEAVSQVIEEIKPTKTKKAKKVSRKR